MDHNTFRMFMASVSDDIGIGEFFQGGYFAGWISHTANGVPTHGLIVSPSESGYTTAAWMPGYTGTYPPGSQSVFDGLANTNQLVGADYPAADFCANLNINGYSDWYLPALYELDIAYENLKPTTQNNSTVSTSGVNDYSIPKRTVNRLADDPSQTNVALFQDGASQAFVLDENNSRFYWTSTRSIFGSNDPWYLNFNNGSWTGQNPVAVLGVRAFRRFAV